MADSVAITITVIEPTVQTYIIGFNVVPTTVNINEDLTFTGYLTRKANATETDADPEPWKVNEEIIEIQIQNSAGEWVNVGQAASTHSTVGGYVYGYFEFAFGLDSIGTPVGTWKFRAHYNGNSSKGLLGCE